jgi:hypothetical protein
MWPTDEDEWARWVVRNRDGAHEQQQSEAICGAGEQEAEEGDQQEEKDFGKKGEQQAQDRGKEWHGWDGGWTWGGQAAEQDYYGKKEAVPEAKGCGKWKDGCKNADPAQPKGGKITKWCTHWGNGTCQRGAFCTFAHSEKDFGTEWFDRSRGACRTMVLCKFWTQGTVAVVMVGWWIGWSVAQHESYPPPYNSQPAHNDALCAEFAQDHRAIHARAADEPFRADIGTEWFDRSTAMNRTMVLCKFFAQGIVMCWLVVVGGRI